VVEIPRHKIHRMLDRLLFNEAFEDIHMWMDKPYVVLKGKKHREFRHDTVAVARILLRTRDIRKAASALFHILIDNVEKNKKNYR